MLLVEPAADARAEVNLVEVELGDSLRLRHAVLGEPELTGLKGYAVAESRTDVELTGCDRKRHHAVTAVELFLGHDDEVVVTLPRGAKDVTRAGTTSVVLSRPPRSRSPGGALPPVVQSVRGRIEIRIARSDARRA